MGIDALGRVTSQIIAEVQTLVDRVVLPPGSNYPDLLHSLHTAFGKGRAIIGGLMNASASIHRIPPELLVKIFALSPRSILHGERAPSGSLAYWPFKAEADVGDLHNLTRVCRYWCDLAIATPTLWTTVGTGSRAHRTAKYLRHSIYLPENLSLDLVVHLDRQGFRAVMKSMVTEAPNIRELHSWNMGSIPDVPSSWRFDANALEHCTLWTDDHILVQSGGPPETNSKLPFSFNNGAAKLRSLCIADFSFHIFPANGFPALTLLLLGACRIESRITMADLFKFLAGCPRLEEAYIYNIQRDASHTTFHSSPPISLPHLRYLYYTHSRCPNSGWKEDADPIECLLARISIPPTCHMYFSVDDRERRATNCSILDSVRRHVHRGEEEDTTPVSHLFLWLATNRLGERSSMQLVFSQGFGSLRVEFETHTDCLDALRSFPHLFSKTEDVRIRYDCMGGYTGLGRHSLANSLPAIFPDLKAITLINEDEGRPWGRYAVRRLPWYLAEPPEPANPSEASSRSEASGPSAAKAAAGSVAVPHPTLDTLWVFVRLKEEVIWLIEILEARAALGFPIRCVVVHHRFEAGSNSKPVLARLRALDVEEVILTEPRTRLASESRSRDKQREGDWALRFPERFSLPAAVRRDWPTVWYGRDSDDQEDGRGDDS